MIYQIQADLIEARKPALMKELSALAAILFLQRTFARALGRLGRQDRPLAAHFLLTPQLAPLLPNLLQGRARRAGFLRHANFDHRRALCRK
jgi:hypothetical protein